jgi:hypothetical protein
MSAKIQKTKSRTSKSKLSKKNSAPRWIIVVVLAIVVATGAFLVYNSFASNSTDPRIGDSTSSYATLWCRRNSSSPTGWICIRHREQGYEAKSVVVQRDSACLSGIKFRLAGALKGPWGCVSLSF